MIPRLLDVTIIIFHLIQPSTNQYIYDLQCPHPSHWKYRGVALCNISDMYLCLLDANNNVYQEKCGTDGPEQQRQGNKIVIRGELDKAECENDKFQPFKFLTNGNDDCVFLKSICNEDGQIVHSDGNSVLNRRCKCDFLRGYAFVVNPSRTCFCDPDIEDCSCFKMQCPEDHSLFPDYKCRMLSNLSKKEKIECEGSSVSRVDTSTQPTCIVSEDPDAEIFTYEEADDVSLDELLDSTKGMASITLIFIIGVCLIPYVAECCKRMIKADNPLRSYLRHHNIYSIKPPNEARKKLNNLRSTEKSEKSESNDFELNNLVLSFANFYCVQTFQDYIKCPATYMIKTLKEMKTHYRDDNDCRFCVLLLILLCKNKFEVKWLNLHHDTNDFWDRIKEICTHCSKQIENSTHLNNIKKTFVLLENTYVNNSKGVYCIHPILYKAVAVECGNSCFELVLKHIDNKFVAENYHFDSSGRTVEDKVIVPKHAEIIYFKRLLDDLRVGDGYSFFHNVQMSDPNFRRKCVKYIEENQQSVSRDVLDRVKLFKQ